MKPGRERDIEIAKLKRLIVHYCAWGLGIWECYDEIDEDGSSGFMSKLPEWSTDRNAAWELFDELPAPMFKEYPKGDDRICQLRIGSNLIVYGKDFADCVSQVWIIWKENE